MSTSAPIIPIPIRVTSDAVRVRHGIAGVVAQYIQDLMNPRGAAA
jgi:hypothetical protein